MQARKKVETGRRLFGLPTPKLAEPVPEEGRGLKAQVRFFIDYSISVAVNSVARKQAPRAKLNLNASAGLSLSIVISTLTNEGNTKFVAYSDDMCRFMSSATGLFVMNESPRELEHFIYLYLSERLAGQESVSVVLERESNSIYALSVLEGCSDDGPRSLQIQAGQTV